MEESFQFKPPLNPAFTEGRNGCSMQRRST